MERERGRESGTGCYLEDGYVRRVGRAGQRRRAGGRAAAAENQRREVINLGPGGRERPVSGGCLWRVGRSTRRLELRSSRRVSTDRRDKRLKVERLFWGRGERV